MSARKSSAVPGGLLHASVRSSLSTFLTASTLCQSSACRATIPAEPIRPTDSFCCRPGPTVWYSDISVGSFRRSLKTWLFSKHYSTRMFSQAMRYINPRCTFWIYIGFSAEICQAVEKCSISQCWRTFQKVPGSGFRRGWLPIFNQFFLVSRYIFGRIFWMKMWSV